MTNYVQETSTNIVYELPDSIVYSFGIQLDNETVAQKPHGRYIAFPLELDLLKSAWDLVGKLEDHSIYQQAKNLLSVIQQTIFTFEQLQFNLGYIPCLQAVMPENSTILFEWIFRDYRIGFNIETNPHESGWYLITNRTLGEISASGFTSGIDLNALVLWLLNFILSHS